MIGPYLINTPLSYFTGYYADIEEIPDMSNKLFMTKYLIWVFWLTIYLSSLLYFWRKLDSLLKYHMKDLQNKPRGDLTLLLKYETLKVASTNLLTAVMVLAFLGSLFIIVYFVFGISYKKSRNETINIIYFVIWNFVEPIILQIAQFVIIYNAVRPTPNNAPFGRMMSVVRRPISTETTRSRIAQKNGFSSLSEKQTSGTSSKKSIKSLPEIQRKSLIFDDQLPAPPTPYITGWDELLYFDDLGDFFAGEIPVEQHPNTHYRRDSSIDISSLNSTAYFSIRSVHSKNDSIYSLPNNSIRSNISKKNTIHSEINI
ncbi:hypothetical protein C1645_752899 [Glomus cerebriforme]|uniref:Uncharacterized protein n=1 Tax=Glomus cerebriforme TaxID=658196 RepID=A0A397TQF0_9GLOM|nr:hypothetical protein C1645_752899 [Glomus cerebriforme]